MSFSASRLTCYALLSAIEEDLRALVAQNLAGQLGTRDLFGEELWTTCVNRLERDLGFVDSEMTLDELIIYADFADLYKLLNTHRGLLSPITHTYLRSITPQLEKLVPIRNRVAHSRPLDFDDLATVLDIAEGFWKSHDIEWLNLAETLVKLKSDPSFVLALSIPADDSDVADKHNLPTPEFDETGFVGRKQQVARLVKLCRGPYPVITIVGDGGLGKTATALKVAYEVLDSPDCPFDAVVWTSTKTAQLTGTEIRAIEGSIRDSLGMLKNVATHLAGENIGDPLEEVLEYLEEFRILLILDNLETVLDDRVRNFLGRLPLGSKVLITSRIGIGAFEYPVKLEAMDEGDSTQLLRALAKTRGVHLLATLPNTKLANYCQRMKNNPGYIKWFVSAVQAGTRPEDVLAKPDLFLNFCMSNVYEYLSQHSRLVLRTMLCLPELNTQAELHFLTELDVIDLQRAIQQLLTTNMVVMSSIPRGSSFESRYDISELARSYLSKHHPIQSEELKTLTRRKKLLIAASEQIKAEQGTNPYSVFSVVTRSQGDLVVARYLIDALRATKRQDFDEAEKLILHALDLAPEYYEVRRVEAWVRASHGNVSAARTAYEAAIELEPSSAPLRFMYGGFLMRYLDDLDGALLQFQAAANLDPASYEVKLEQARANLYLKEFQKAREVIDGLIGAGNLSTWNRRKVYDLHLQYFQRLADHLVGLHEYLAALECIEKLREAYAACPSELLDEQMKKALRKTIGTAETCATLIQNEEDRYKADELAKWLYRFANSSEVVALHVGQHGTGILEVLKRQSGYGFINAGPGASIFFHRDDLVDPGDWHLFSAGAKVYFTVTKDVRGRWRAVAVGPA